MKKYSIILLLNLFTVLMYAGAVIGFSEIIVHGCWAVIAALFLELYKHYM